jgi:hypothetical protein
MPIDLGSGKWKIEGMVNDGVARGVAKGSPACNSYLRIAET